MHNILKYLKPNSHKDLTRNRIHSIYNTPKQRVLKKKVLKYCHLIESELDFTYLKE